MKKPKKIRAVKPPTPPPVPQEPDSSMTFERMVKLENLRPGGPRLAVFDGVDGIGAACYAIQNNAGKARVPSSAPVDFNACGPWSAVMAPSEFNNYALIKSLQFLEVAQNALVAALRS